MTELACCAAVNKAQGKLRRPGYGTQTRIGISGYIYNNGELSSRWSAALSASPQLFTFTFSFSSSTEGCFVPTGPKQSHCLSALQDVGGPELMILKGHRFFKGYKSCLEILLLQKC